MIQAVEFRRSLIWNTIGTTFNSLTSLFLMALVTRINGIYEAGVFALAFSTACILYVIGTYSGRVYQVTESSKQITDVDYLLSRFISVSVMILASVLFVIFRKYGLNDAKIFIALAVYKALEAFSDVLYGILQKNNLLYKVGQSYFIKSTLTILVFSLTDIYTHNLMLSCVFINIVWIVCIICMDIPSCLVFIKSNPYAKAYNILFLYKKGFFVFATMFMGIYITNASKYAIDNYLSNDIQTIYGIIIMPATAISLLGQFVFHPYLNQMASMNNQRNYDALFHITLKVAFYILIFGVLTIIGAFLFGIPVLNTIYSLDLTTYRPHLLIILAAATLYNIGGTFSSMLTTVRITFVQFIIYIVLTIVAWSSSNYLTKLFYMDGAVAAYVLVMAGFFLLYTTVSIIFIKYGVT